MIVVPERLDLQTVSDDANLAQFHVNGHDWLVDLSAVRFVDSTGVGWLVRATKSLRSVGRQMICFSASTAIRRALVLMRLENFFDIAPDETSARRLVRARSLESSHWVEWPPAGSGLPLIWKGEVTAANAEEIWKHTAAYIETISIGRSARDEFWSVDRSDPAPGGQPLAPAQLICIDISGVRFLDSSGLGVMLRVKKLVECNGWGVKFQGAQSSVLSVIRLARLGDILAV